MIGQYYYGITYQMVLEADQKGYIYYLTQIITNIINAILTYVFIKLNFNIHFIKLFASSIFIIRPIILKIYIYKKYNISKNAKEDKDLIKNRWDGIGHTIAYFVHNKTDVFVLTIMSSINNVSIYSIYALVVNGLRTIISTICSPIEAAFGNIIAKKEEKVLLRRFSTYELLVDLMSVILFSTGLLLIIPFIELYTASFDINYVYKDFAILILLSEFIYCIRIPYHSIIISSGNYKQTKKGAFIEAFINIAISIVLVHILGLVGVAIGTLIAMVYRLIDYLFYLRKNILSRNITSGLKRICISLIMLFLNYFIISTIYTPVFNNYILFIINGFCILLIIGICNMAIYWILFRKDFMEILSLVRVLLKRKKRS